MTLKDWFKEDAKHAQAIYWGKNGRKYIYHNGQKLSKMAEQLRVIEEVELNGTDKIGAWLQ